jgi:KaiC/GvpD/RAD55 family RecA-like ATPase
MGTNELVISNPFGKIGDATDDIIKEGNFGAVLARAGVGKTALLVQLGLNALLREKNVLHISLNDPVTKVSLYYKEVFGNIAELNKIQGTLAIWDTILPHRFIMTFKVEGFSVPKLEERLTDLIEQNIFSPNLVIIDGLPFDENMENPLKELKVLADKNNFSVWFTVTTHRHEESRSLKYPPQMASISDLFEVIIQLQPEGKSIHVLPLKGGRDMENPPTLIFDPATMILREEG